VEAVTNAHRCNETPKAWWQHLILLAVPAAAQMRRERKPTAEINVVLCTTDAPRQRQAGGLQ
jgi:hypothetical protein